MESREIIQRLEQCGFTLLRVNGSHHVLGRPDGQRVVVPHPRKDIPAGTLRNIFRQAGWPWPPR
ncbi:type II toxin-antitoxin system HicA family toxin [Fundidesulfovibrio agrisoli]|uniref:type II toxin-antitoxin system HicA family toxin n=1 Tax=Fundidesulfovibrio agrisoli TaxID=2922717 RepID=UPI001FADD7F5|nr:type II toxin-antitoxin system HicA family toxin [Fundidesulfovibrio agrisoli]